MRNPYRTNRKRSTKKPSRNQRARLVEKLYLAQLHLEQWFVGYMAELRANSTRYVALEGSIDPRPTI